jgi:hypothetical protein
MASQRRYQPQYEDDGYRSEKRPTCQHLPGEGKEVTMPQAKQTSKRKRRSKALPVLGAAGLSLSLAGTASAVPGGPAVNLHTSGNGDGNQVFLGEEEIADVSLATFYVFDKEDLGGSSGSSVELVRHGCHGCHGCGGRGCHRGCGGCHHGCGCHGCHHGCGWHGCGGCGGCGGWRWGGCGGCGGCGCWCVRVGGVAVCGR